MGFLRCPRCGRLYWPVRPGQPSCSPACDGQKRLDLLYVGSVKDLRDELERRRNSGEVRDQDTPRGEQ
jgi:hypothetical protein